MKPTIYISGAMSGIQKKAYRARFQQAEQRLRRLGAEPINPCKFFLAKYFYWLMGYRLMLIYDLWRLSHCDGIYMLNGYNQSKGASIEHRNAQQGGQLILHENMKDSTIYKRLFCNKF